MVRKPGPKSFLDQCLSTHWPHDTLVKPSIPWWTLRNREVTSDLCVHGIVCGDRVLELTSLQIPECSYLFLIQYERHDWTPGDRPLSARNTLFTTLSGVSSPRIWLPRMPGTANAPPFRGNLTSHPQECGLPLWPHQGNRVQITLFPWRYGSQALGDWALNNTTCWTWPVSQASALPSLARLSFYGSFSCMK